MRRWNGWGDETQSMGLPEGGQAFLQARVGLANALPDAQLAQVLAQVPPSRMPDHALISTDPELRVRHARGQSLPDWLALRSGDLGVFPDGVALPETAEQIAELLAFCTRENIEVIAYGGGTSVAGHINPLASNRPVLTVSLARMNQLLDFDAESQIATFGAGVPGPQLEAQLRARGYTLGHFPQSFELSTLGGWVASRSSGQQSLRYGRIEQLFAGGRLETPIGCLQLPTVPASSAGPDLREWVMGSEGRMGILSEVKVRVSRLPEREDFYVIFFPDWASAKAAARELVQQRVQLSMLRLSNAIETETQLALAGHPRLIGLLERYLSLRGASDGKCMMTLGITGSRAQCRAIHGHMKREVRRFGGIHTGRYLGSRWAEKRFAMPHLRETLWQQGYVVDTLETATDWDNVDALVAGIETQLNSALAPEAERAHVFTHLSHFYGQGCSIYTTYVFRTGPDYATTLAWWKRLKHNTSAYIVAHRGTISHQHGVGKDHAAYLPVEKGPLGMKAIETLMATFDPLAQLNPGTLLAKPLAASPSAKPLTDAETKALL